MQSSSVLPQVVRYTWVSRLAAFTNIILLEEVDQAKARKWFYPCKKINHQRLPIVDIGDTLTCNHPQQRSAADKGKQSIHKCPETTGRGEPR